MPVTTPALYTYEHPRPSVTVDMILFAFQNDELTVLLIRRTHDPYAGKWALPGGFVGEEEDLYDAALRELKEETNVSNVYLEQLYTFGQPDRDPRARHPGGRPRARARAPGRSRRTTRGAGASNRASR